MRSGGRPRPYARCASVSYQIDERAAQAARAAETATAARLVQMGYIKTWDEFQSAVEILYGNSPAKARYLVNIRRVDGCLVFKVTDDKTVLKFWTDQAADLKKFERLNKYLMRQMQNRPLGVAAEMPAATAGADLPKAPGGPQDAVPAQAPTEPRTPAATAAESSGPPSNKGQGKQQGKKKQRGKRR